MIVGIYCALEIWDLLVRNILKKYKTQYIKIGRDELEDDALLKAEEVLKNGGVIALPTETVYGLVGDLFSKKAIDTIYRVKGRDLPKQLPVFIPDVEYARLYAEEAQPWVYTLMSAFWPGPLTVILNKKEFTDIPINSATLGFRIPDHPAPLALLKRCGPLVSTSANVSGEKDALNADEVKKYFEGEIELILDGGHAALGMPSTVVDCSGNSPKIIREGKITKEDIEKAINT